VFYDDDSKITSTSRKDLQSGKHYDVFNSGIYISNRRTEVYHKSKLVPGVEKMPFPVLLRPLEKLAINMGGTMGSLGTQDDRMVFTDPVNSAGLAPVICYESVYADYLTEYVRRGANLLFIITNDGWWDDTPGYVQHLNYARLRAIENRRQIARCANTGISCFISETGALYDETPWWKEAVITRTLYKNNELTFFSKYGDLISYCCSAITVLFIFWSWFLTLRRKFGATGPMA
jgi:apolipoprotein N-acyltransferase